MSELHDLAAHIVDQWLQKAQEDVRTAVYLLTMGQNCPYGIVCYHAQQCIEKCIKAVLIYHNLEIPRIHDLGKLMRLLPSTVRLPLSLEEQDRLTDYATTSRYPGESEPLTRIEAEEAVSIAQRVYEASAAYMLLGSH